MVREFADKAEKEARLVKCGKNLACVRLPYLCTRAAGPCRSIPSHRCSRTVRCACRTCSWPSGRNNPCLLHTERSSATDLPGCSCLWGGLRGEKQTQRIAGCSRIRLYHLAIRQFKCSVVVSGGFWHKFTYLQGA